MINSNKSVHSVIKEILQTLVHAAGLKNIWVHTMPPMNIPCRE